MTTYPALPRLTARVILALGCFALPLAAQVAPKATEPVEPAPARPVTATSKSPAPTEAITLEAFTINTDKDNGFMAANAGTAMRMSLDMADVPVAYSVMTRDFIDALGITNIQEANLWMPSGSPVLDGNGADVFGITTMVQVRGIIQGNGGSGAGTVTSRNNYLSSSTQDSYNMERYDFGRGPNAAIFNIGGSPLGGALGAVSKRARYDRNFETIETKFGSWDYKRATLDVNRALTDKLAVRANSVWMDRDGWRRGEVEKIKGITGTLSYLWRPMTEIRVEASTEKLSRTTPQTQLFDTVTGWDGVTVFNQPISNANYGTATVPGTPTSLGRVLTFQGESQGVDRRTGGYYVWSPTSGQNVLMNYQNEAYTRAGDNTANTPIYGNGRVWVRGTGLPFGNTAPQTTTPTITPGAGGTNLNFLYQPDLPDDRFSRVLSNSKFRLPDKRDTNATDTPSLVQRSKDLTVALTHQIGTRWLFEIGANYNSTNDRRGSGNDFRTIRLDINQLLPNGALNPNYLEPYMEGTISFAPIKIENRAVRFNAAYKADYGKWGDYNVNFTAGLTLKDQLDTTEQLSMKTSADPRLWTGTDDLIRVRHYFYTGGRPYTDEGVPTQLVRRDFAADNNSFTTSTRAVAPEWVMNSNWSKSQSRFFATGAAISAKYLEGKLVVLLAARFDNARSQVWQAVNRGDLPTNWNGRDLIYRPNAPADWKTLSYIPRDAAGNPTSTIPIPAATRPRTGVTLPGSTVANIFTNRNPLYLNDRFRDDYSPPVNKRTPHNFSTGATYHVTRWLALVGNYATSYALPRTNSFDLTGDLTDVQVGKGFDGTLRFRLPNGGLSANIGYYFSSEDKRATNSLINGSINGLYGRNAATDSAIGSRNNLGLVDLFGVDYESRRNSGVEFEIVGALKNGLRLIFNGSYGGITTFNRYPLSKAYVTENAATFLKVLEAAGGRLDPTLKNPGSPNAPGLAVVNSAITAAINSEQIGAVNDYNNLWVQYENVLNNAPVKGDKRITSNIFADYTIRSGRARGLRIGLGVQYRGDIVAGYRTGDSVVDPTTGLVVAKYGTAGLQYPIYTAQPLNSVANLGYSMRLNRGWGWFAGKQVSFQLNIRNLLNQQKVFYQGDTVVPRAPGGDFSIPYRTSVPSKIALYQEPISAIFTTTLRL